MIYNKPTYSAAYGGGHDIHISDNSNINKGSYASGGTYYGASEGMTARSLTKENNFTVKEIEVYQVQILWSSLY